MEDAKLNVTLICQNVLRIRVYGMSSTCSGPELEWQASIEYNGMVLMAISTAVLDGVHQRAMKMLVEWLQTSSAQTHWLELVPAPLLHPTILEVGGISAYLEELLSICMHAPIMHVQAFACHSLSCLGAWMLLKHAIVCCLQESQPAVSTRRALPLLARACEHA